MAPLNMVVVVAALATLSTMANADGCADDGSCEAVKHSAINMLQGNMGLQKSNHELTVGIGSCANDWNGLWYDSFQNDKTAIYITDNPKSDEIEIYSHTKQGTAWKYFNAGVKVDDETNVFQWHVTANRTASKPLVYQVSANSSNSYILQMDPNKCMIAVFSSSSKWDPDHAPVPTDIKVYIRGLSLQRLMQQWVCIED